jgi:hypothetical protein
MITLRGKLTRTLVEAKAATPATTRSNLAPSESGVIGHDVTTAPQNESTSAMDSAPVESGAIQVMASKESSMVEEWLWRGVWAFGSLPEQAGDALADAAPSTAIAETTHADGPSHGITGGALVNTQRQPTSNVAQDDLTISALEAKPRPFSYRFIKLVDATHVLVPSSLVLPDDDDNQDANANAQEKIDHLGRVVDITNGPIRSTGNMDDILKQDAQEVLVSSNANDKQNQHVDENSQDNEQTSTNQVDKLPKNDSSNSLSPSVGEAAVQNPYQDAKNHDDKPADSADVTMSGDKSSPPAQNAEKTTHPTMTAAAVLPPPTAQTNLTSIPTKQTFGDAPYTDAHLTYPLGTCPPGGKWEGHFENIVPNTFNPSKKRKDKKDNRIREMFYLFFNATPPADAMTAFVAEDSTSAANDLLIAAGDGETDESKQEDDANHLLLPKGRIHVRGYGTNRFGTFEIVGSFDPKNGMLHCQR